MATTRTEARQIVIAAGFDTVNYDAAERCTACRRNTTQAIRGGVAFCPAHVGAALDVARRYAEIDVAK